MFVVYLGYWSYNSDSKTYSSNVYCSYDYNIEASFDKEEDANKLSEFLESIGLDSYYDEYLGKVLRNKYNSLDEYIDIADWDNIESLKK